MYWRRFRKDTAAGVVDGLTHNKMSVSSSDDSHPPTLDGELVARHSENETASNACSSRSVKVHHFLRLLRLARLEHE